MVALLDHQASQAEILGQPSCRHRPGQSGSSHNDIYAVFHHSVASVSALVYPAVSDACFVTLKQKSMLASPKAVFAVELPDHFQA
jgi:hypothetical protein